MREAISRGGEDGFTFVELMIVVMIIGILVGIAVLSFVFSVQRSKETACKANLKTIKGALRTYLAKNGHYPSSLQELVPDYIESERGLSCPESGEAYVYDPDTGEVSCPYHTGF